ncbi:MAG: hypothetical protein AAFR71_16730 [Pseudomonadota bacterium]
MTCYPDDFRHLVEGFDLSVEKQNALIHTVWRIMESAVDRAWNADPVQMVMAEQACKSAMDSGPVIDLEVGEYHALSNTFNHKKGDGSS